MKFTCVKTLLIAVLLFGIQYSSNAQTVSLTANIYAVGFDNLEFDRPNTSIDLETTSSFSGNLRLFSRKKWALRLGGGFENLEYKVGGTSINEAYQAQRRDVKGLVGLEKHFVMGPLMVYPGVLIPITIVGDDNVAAQNFDDIKNGHTRAGLGLVLGANMALLNFFKVGFEINYNYNNFTAEIWESSQTLSVADLSGMNFDSAFTIGIAF